MGYTGWNKGMVERVILFRESDGVALDMPAGILIPVAVPRESETRVPVASGGMRTVGRERDLTVRTHRPDADRIMRRLRADGVKVSAWAIGRPEPQNGVHTAFLEQDEPGGSSPGGMASGGLDGEEITLHTHRRHAAVWTSPDLLSGVPWTGQTAVDLGSATKPLPYTPRINGSALDTLYETPGAMLPGPSGYRGPVWAVTSGDDPGDGLFSEAEYDGTDAVVVMPLPAPGLALEAQATAGGSGLTLTLAAYTRAGALLTSDADTVATTEDATASLTLPNGVWYVALRIQGPVVRVPYLFVASANAGAVYILYTASDGAIYTADGTVIYTP